METKKIIEATATKGTFLEYELIGGCYNELMQEFYTTLDLYTFDQQDLGLKRFLEDNGFTVRDHGDAETHHYAITDTNIYISTSGFVHIYKK